MKTLLSCLLSVIFLTFLASTNLQAQADGSGTIKATVLDEKMQPMPYAVVRILGLNIGVQTDLDGVANLRGVSPGTYDVEVRMVSYKRYLKKSVLIKAGQTTYLDYTMQLIGLECDTCIVYEIFAEPTIDKTVSTLNSIDATQIRNMAVNRGDITAMAVNICSSCNTTPSGGLVMRGSRPGFSQTFVDGEKMYGSADIPGLAIGGMTVLSGGIPAEYGDLTGGAIIITTKNSVTGYQYKATMYEDLAEKQEAERLAEAEKRGVKITKTDVIEDQKSSEDSTQNPKDSLQQTPQSNPQINPQQPEVDQQETAPVLPPTQPAEKPKN